MGQSPTPAPGNALDAIIARAEANGDQKTARGATNIKIALRSVKPSDLNGISCGKDVSTTKISVESGRDVVGKLLEKGLDQYLPALAAAINSAYASGALVFLVAEKIGPDSVEILNNSQKHSRDEVTAAARQILEATKTETFQKLDTNTMAKILSCTM